tara:strand:- start:2743 stop:3078 length:336 start_codon:yes stop_codon:yes gene_type:complete
MDVDLRRKFGIFTFCLGLGALGWLGFTDTLGRVEGIIFQSVPVDIPDLNHPVTVSVSGREVLVSGFVNFQDQRACILKQMQCISGHLQITDGLVLSASLSPYVTEATKGGR